MTETRRVPLTGLVRGVPAITLLGDPETLVTGVVHDTRDVRAGSLFCCVLGANVDGHDLAPRAVEGGAAALLVERRLDLPVPQLVVPSVRAAMGPVASAFWDDPSRRLDVLGVTGTNGKTTTVHLLTAVLQGCGRPTGQIGTLTGARTTPEATELQATLAGFAAEGMAAVAMEVSSHALAQRRVDATWFRVAGFTNLSPEHLDFHVDMPNYFAAKASLFTPDRCAAAVIDVDDEWGRRLAEQVTVPAVHVSLRDVEPIEIDRRGSRCRWRGEELVVPLGGRFNLSNALLAAEAARAVGLDASAIASAMALAGPVPGRFEPVEAGQPFSVVVDYAHTPDGLVKVLAAAREVAGDARVLVVFGAGGDRDQAKRPAMGRAARQGADVVVLTSDNTRGEDPQAIISAVLAGISDPQTVIVEPDRRAAIGIALDAARAGDVVVIAGKGHEAVQEVGTEQLPFDDRTEARAALARAGYGS